MIRRSQSDPKKRGKFVRRPFPRRKVCKFCANKIDIDYKAPNVLKASTSDRGKILPRRFTGTCAKHQRRLTQAIKRARMLAMLPFTSPKY